MHRRNFLQGLAGPLLAQGTAKPNVLFLFSDDQRFDTIRALGNKEIQTPHLDRLCARGVAFTQAMIPGGNQGAVCVPSRAMLMTGQSLYHATEALAGKRPYELWPGYLGKQGYRTFGAGKWHNGPKTYQEAFASGGPVMFGGMNDHYRTPVVAYRADGKYGETDVVRDPAKSSSELFADSLIEFLRAQRGDQPFCAYVAFTAPHDPRQAPAEWRRRYAAEKITVPPNFLPKHPFDNGELEVRDEKLLPWPRTRTAVQKEIADYYALISHLDSQIGRILDVLDRTGLSRNTLVVFAGDNGLALGQHGLMGKQNVYDHSIRVPLVVAGPGVVKGRRSEAAVYLYDIFATLCEMVGVAKPASVEGVSFAAALRGEVFAGRASTFHAYREFQRAVRTQSHKLIRYRVKGTETWQMFDLRRDPWEMRDLSAEPGEARRRAEMEEMLRVWQREVGDPQAE